MGAGREAAGEEPLEAGHTMAASGAPLALEAAALNLISASQIFCVLAR